jgi:hypothetical protein
MLENEDNFKEIHYRMRGINLECIKKYSKENNISLYDVYNKLLNNESITFDLLTVKPSFKTNKDRTMSNVKEFNTISAKNLKDIVNEFIAFEEERLNKLELNGEYHDLSEYGKPITPKTPE